MKNQVNHRPEKDSVEIELRKLYVKWFTDPVSFFKEVLDAELSNQQEELCFLLRDMWTAKGKRGNGVELTDYEKDIASKVGISVHSGKGAGKDFVIAGLIILYLLIFTPFKGICSAMSEAQLNDILSNEIALHLKRNSDLKKCPIRLKGIIGINKKRIFKKTNKIGADHDFMSKRTISIRKGEGTEGEALQGYHSKYMLLIVDEASGPPDGVFKPLAATLTDPQNVCILIGNPTKYSGFFYRTHYDKIEKKRWAQLRWNLEESTMPDIKPGIKEYLENEKEYGIDSTQYRINVLGLPPVSSKDALIPLHWIYRCVDNDILDPNQVKDENGKDTPRKAPVVIGCDPGRTGDDTGIIRRSGRYVHDNPISKVSYDTMVVADWVKIENKLHEADRICVEVGGLGYGTTDKLTRDQVDHYQVNMQSAAALNERFYNKRAELYWKLRELIKNGAIRLPNNEKLIYEISGVMIKEQEPKLLLVSKKEMLLKGVKSPNLSDALVVSLEVDDDCIDAAEEAKDRERQRYEPRENFNDNRTWMAMS